MRYVTAKQISATVTSFQSRIPAVLIGNDMRTDVTTTAHYWKVGQVHDSAVNIWVDISSSSETIKTAIRSAVRYLQQSKYLSSSSSFTVNFFFSIIIIVSDER